MSLTARQWLDKIRALPLPPKVRIMNVCGGHERSISMAGLRGAIPDNIELIPGPGCPVCICPEEDVYEAIQLALNEDVILLAFGDMLRVPVNVPRTKVRTLEQAKAAGADIRPIASPGEAVLIANLNKNKKIVFFAAGFETTTAPVASMMVEGIPKNLFILLSGRLTWPAVEMLLASEEAGFDALIAPGHVATVMGAHEWQFVVDKYEIPAAIAGFTAESLLAAMYSTLRQLIEGNYFLDNCYSEVVKLKGNVTARQHLQKSMNVTDAMWRGVGVIPLSGFALREEFTAYDARKQLPSYADPERRHIGKMPGGCDCARVVLGKIYPNECRIYGAACTPRNPIGPCMVSDEGACRIWWANGIRQSTHQPNSEISNKVSVS
jgi:hydrogenase expression/formation protein HypD